jgi:hypothetical protein
MRIEAHLDKVRRLDAVRARLDPREDFELWFWMSMSGGTHAFNAALHAAGATVAADSFCTQAANLYLEPGREPGTWAPAIRFDGDVLHVGLPAIDAPIPPELERAGHALDVLEEVRDPCVRGDRPVTPDLVAAVDAAYRDCLRLTALVVEAAGSGT